MVNAEFLAMLLVIVYVGAVALLFLFVIMMLNIDFKKQTKNLSKYLPVGALIAFILLCEILIVINSIDLLQYINNDLNLSKTHIINFEESNTFQIGKILYTEFSLHFQLAGLILLIAMVGAVVLAHRTKDDLKRQNINTQVNRKRDDSVKIVKVLSNKGI